jgi:ABC-type protease/lipase transport system fused ATPase/permease subunit
MLCALAAALVTSKTTVCLSGLDAGGMPSVARSIHMAVVFALLGIAVMLVLTAVTVLVAIAAATEVFPPRRASESEEDDGRSVAESDHARMRPAR